MSDSRSDSAAPVVVNESLVPWRKAASTALKRCRRLHNRLVKELAVAQQAGQLRAGAEALKSQLHLVERGSDRVVVAAPWLPAQQVVVALRRDMSPKANLARIFRRAKGFEKALPMISERLAATEARMCELAEAIERIDGWRQAQEPIGSDDHGRLVAQLRKLGARLAGSNSASLRESAQGKSKNSRGVLPKGLRRFWTSRGTDIIAGKDARANDALVVRVARGRDVWLHVRDQPGAHVLLRMVRMETAPHSDELLQAAVLCAHLSGVAKGAWCDVSWARAKHVRKPKRAAPGLVLVSAEKTLRVRVDGEVVDALYRRRDLAMSGGEGSVEQSQASLR